MGTGGGLWERRYLITPEKVEEEDYVDDDDDDDERG